MRLHRLYRPSARPSARFRRSMESVHGASAGSIPIRCNGGLPRSQDADAAPVDAWWSGWLLSGADCCDEPVLLKLPQHEKDLLAERAGLAGLSYSEYVMALLRQEPVDDEGRPVWVLVEDHGEALPLAM